MEHKGMERKLTTILTADVVGYSRLMGEDEAGTLAALKAHRRELLNPKADQYRGRIVKLMGDGALMEFASVVDAVHYATEVQCAMAERNAGISPERRILYRIGINIGDIIVEGDDIYGDGVNVAARLEGLCEPDGICVSRNVFNQVKSKLDLTFEHLGEKEVKNIAEPVTVYRIVLDEKASALVSPVVQGIPKRIRKWQPVALAAAAVSILAAGVVLWSQPWAPHVEPASVERMTFALPEKPSIAVLPFDNLSGDPSQDYFADGLTDDLITDLSKIPDIFVIARNSTFTYKDNPTKVQRVAEDLGVRYVLEGSVRRAGEQVRINAQLIDALKGHHLWAERYDDEFTNIFDLQDKVIDHIVAALAINLTSAELARTEKSETEIPQAYDAFLQGWDHFRRQTPEDVDKAVTFFEKAVQLDPDYSRALAGLAAAYWNKVSLAWEFAIGKEWAHDYEKAIAYLSRALEKPTADAYAVSAEILVLHGRHEETLAHIDEAITLDPNNAESHISRARVLNAIGRAKDAEQSARLAMRLNPHFLPDYLRALGRSLFHQERYEEAVETFRRVVDQQPDVVDDFVTLAAAYGHLGRFEEAEEATARYNELARRTGYTPLSVQEPGFWWYGDMFAYDEAYRARLLDGLRKAGLPEGAGAPERYADYKALLRRDDKGTYDVKGAEEIDPETAWTFSQRNAVFIDVRDAGSYARGHIPEAVHLELNTGLSQESLLRVIGINDPVIFYCWGKYCPYSAWASAKAVTWGFSRVYRLPDGFPGWDDAGYPVQVGNEG